MNESATQTMHGETRFQDDQLELLNTVRPSEHVDSLENAQLQMQVVTARRFPRSIKKFLADSESMATLNVETAASCFYSVPRAGKTISGPSVRLAEICMSAWGHLDCGTRVKEIGATHVTVEGFVWDMMSNVKVRQEVRRNIVTKNGQRYKEDMIANTVNAGASIALRNAILRVIPRAYVDQLWEKARKVAIGDAKTLSATRETAVAYFLKIPGLTAERVYAAMDVKGIDDLTIDHVGVLKGYATAIKDGEATVDECFPPLEKAPDEKSLAEKIRGAAGNGKPKAAEPPASVPDVPKDESPPAPTPATAPAPEEAKQLEPPAPSSEPLDPLVNVRTELVRVGHDDKWAAKQLKIKMLDSSNAEQAAWLLAKLAKMPAAVELADDDLLDQLSMECARTGKAFLALPPLYPDLGIDPSRVTVTQAKELIRRLGSLPDARQAGDE